MTLSLIAAVDLDGVIGQDQGMPWRLRDDLRRFRRITMGHPIIMGRKTFETLKAPLSGRTNIVMTRREGWEAPEGVLVARSAEEALELARGAEGSEEIFIGGGGEIYGLFLEEADTLYLTRVLTHAGGDTHFPEVDEADWDVVERRERFADSDNDHPTEFLIMERIS